MKRKSDIRELLIIEPFSGGSHKQLIDTLVSYLHRTEPHCTITLHSMPPKKWHWSMRVSGAVMAQRIREISVEEANRMTIFSTSMLNWAELLALRPDLVPCKKIMYMHENQLVYPVKKTSDTDFQLGWIQIVSSTVCDILLFNSKHNKDSFLGSITSFLNKIPLSSPYRPHYLKDKILSKTMEILHFPVDLSFKNDPEFSTPSTEGENTPLRILWPHRWEHDKNPAEFLQAIGELQRLGHHFELVLLGQGFSEIPEEFQTLLSSFSSQIYHSGFIECRKAYLRMVGSCDIVVSTANHEFFGVAMVEAVATGCFPIAPNRLSYPEIFPSHCLYSSFAGLIKKLKKLCSPHELARLRAKETPFHGINVFRFSSEALLPRFRNQLLEPESDPIYEEH